MTTSQIFRCKYVANLLCTWTHHCTRPACTYRYIAMICTLTLQYCVQPSKHRWHFYTTKASHFISTVKVKWGHEVMLHVSNTLLPIHCSNLPVTQPVTRVSACHGPLVRHVSGSKLGTRDRLFYGQKFLWFPGQSVDNTHLASFHIPILSLDAILPQLLIVSLYAPHI
jgi:hypothetical protein